MFVNIVHRHGLVPKAVMPESQSSSNTRRMNALLLHKLREGAHALRELRGSGAPMEAARAAKQDLLAVIHRMLCIHLGTPPTHFTWQWHDKDKGFHRDAETTPQEFAARYATLPLDEYACLVHDPRPEHPYGRTYTVEYLGNVIGGDIVKYLNVDIDTMKRVAQQSIMDGEPVWFGCDVGKMMRRDVGVWDERLFDYESVYRTSFGLDKAQRLDYHQTLMTHAMLFTGVDVEDGTPRRWRVENSWGDEDNGEKGFYVMNDSWFDEHMFEIAARRSSLTPELITALDAPPTVLPPWDPMGSLARAL
jgi:bleomycin hydrolase